ncbi:hypothetical protein DPX16_17497 [Anabarilius grahami]|uniref:Uncharacterized protein n=1 Tax=Anabarilius grahami TaxID=495550 RepID=A0A3N0XZ52_ANAGA|nr:hypothetical protein DPX16_17497 [Anabarilius grahami]
MNGNPMLQLTGLRMLDHHRPLVTYANIGEQQNMLVQELERGERKKGTILHRHPSPMLSPSMALEEKRLRPENSEQGNCKLALVDRQIRGDEKLGISSTITHFASALQSLSAENKSLRLVQQSSSHCFNSVNQPYGKTCLKTVIFCYSICLIVTKKGWMREMQDGDKVQMIYDTEVDRRKGRNADRHVSMGEGERFGSQYKPAATDAGTASPRYHASTSTPSLSTQAIRMNEAEKRY